MVDTQASEYLSGPIRCFSLSSEASHSAVIMSGSLSLSVTKLQKILLYCHVFLPCLCVSSGHCCCCELPVGVEKRGNSIL